MTDTKIQEILLYDADQLIAMTKYTLRPDKRATCSREELQRHTSHLVMSIDVGVRNLAIALWLLPSVWVAANYAHVDRWDNFPARLVGLCHIDCVDANLKRAAKGLADDKRETPGQRAFRHQAAFDMIAAALDTRTYLAAVTCFCIEWQYDINYLMREMASSVYGYMRHGASRRALSFAPAAAVPPFMSIEPAKKTETLPVVGSRDPKQRKHESSICLVGWIVTVAQKCAVPAISAWYIQVLEYLESLRKCDDVSDAALQAWVAFFGQLVEPCFSAHQYTTMLNADIRMQTRALWWDAASKTAFGKKLIEKYDAQLTKPLPKRRSPGQWKRKRRLDRAAAPKSAAVGSSATNSSVSKSSASKIVKTPARSKPKPKSKTKTKLFSPPPPTSGMLAVLSALPSLSSMPSSSSVPRPILAASTTSAPSKPSSPIAKPKSRPKHRPKPRHHIATNADGDGEDPTYNDFGGFGTPKYDTSYERVPTELIPAGNTPAPKSNFVDLSIDAISSDDELYIRLLKQKISKHG